MRLPQRSRRFGVGKEIGGCVYMHRTYEHLLGPVAEDAQAHIPDDFPYTIVKLNLRTYAVSFVTCPDFDTADEPTVGAIWTVSPDGATSFLAPPTDPYIYHHKWLMVGDGYTGFAVSEAVARSREWLALEGVDVRRIGRRSYWNEIVLPRLTVGSSS